MLILLLGMVHSLIYRLFYNQNTPIEYEPPGFKTAIDELPDIFGRDLDIGSVSTRHHTMACQVHTKSGEVTAHEDSTQDLISKLKHTGDREGQLYEIEEEEASDYNSDVGTDGVESSGLPEPTEHYHQRSAAGKKGTLSSKPLNQKPQPPVLLAPNSFPQSPQQSVQLEDSMNFNSPPSCVCERTLEDYELVSCQSCHQLSHAICYGLIGDKSEFNCHKCCEMIPVEGKNIDLIVLELQDLAMRRRAVMHLKHNNLPCARAGIALKIGEKG
jgi:HORMA domain